MQVVLPRHSDSWERICPDRLCESGPWMEDGEYDTDATSSQDSPPAIGLALVSGVGASGTGSPPMKNILEKRAHRQATTSLTTLYACFPCREGHGRIPGEGGVFLNSDAQAYGASSAVPARRALPGAMPHVADWPIHQDSASFGR